MSLLVDGELVLYGSVGFDFLDDYFTATQVMEALAEIGRDADFTARINSGGGLAYEGIAIYNAMKAHKGKIRIEVDGIAASAASIIAMAGDEIVMRQAADMMIHDPSGITYGTEADHLTSISALSRLGTGMAGIYADQTGGDADAIRDDMRAELWMSGAEAVERGFANEADERAPVEAAAFPYQIYSRAPRRLTALASQRGWSPTAFIKPTASAVKPKDHEKETPTMAPKPEAADKKPAIPAPSGGGAEAVSVADVKARIQAITGADAAKGREALASHLAFNTEMSAEDAIAAMEAAANDAPKAQTDDAPDPGSYQNRRSAAAELAQPAPGGSDKPKAAIDTGGIYAARRAGKEA